MILVRHGDAGDKSRWRGPDERRPLSRLGRTQAESLVRTLRRDPVTVLWTSPAVRCLATLAPLAAARGLTVRLQPLLGKDGRTTELVDWLVAADTTGWVLCTHGEVFEALYEVALERRIVRGSRRVTAKGAAWRTTGTGGTATYLPPVPRS